MTLPTSPLEDRVRQVTLDLANKAGVSVAAVMGKTHRREVVAVRYAAMRQVKREMPEATLSQLARCFNRANHTSVLYALRKGDA